MKLPDDSWSFVLIDLQCVGFFFIHVLFISINVRSRYTGNTDRCLYCWVCVWSRYKYVQVTHIVYYVILIKMFKTFFFAKIFISTIYYGSGVGLVVKNQGESARTGWLWLALNQDNVSVWSDMSTHRLLFQ